MQDTSATTLAMTSAAATPLPTALAAALGGTPAALVDLAGACTYPEFSVTSQELEALLEGAGAFDLGYRGQVAVRGEDRLRWLNGMLTNNIQGLAEGTGNYSFVLNAQGRIQGDCDAYRMADHLLLVTERSQLPALLAHFDHFIIMDDVVLEDVSATRTSLGLAGPRAADLLASLNVHVPAAETSGLWLIQTQIDGVPVQVTGGYPTASPRLELWCAHESVRALWATLLAAGAVPCGVHAVEKLRVLEGTPRFGVDIAERDLPQETSQSRALHFAKGCYLGQEIVERIRSRGNVHRRMAQFTLSALPSALPAELSAGSQSAGRLTSATTWRDAHFGMGIVRADAAERHATLDFPGGRATLLSGPVLPRTSQTALPASV